MVIIFYESQLKMSPVWRRNPMSTLQIYKKFLVINSFTHHSYFILPPQLPSSIHSLILSPPFTPSSLHSFNPSPINSFNLTAVIPLSQQPGSSLSPFPRFSKRPSCAQRPPLHTKPPPTPPPCAQGPPLHTGRWLMSSICLGVFYGGDNLF